MANLSQYHAKRQRFSRWLLTLVVFWQALLIFMPVAEAKATGGEGQWEAVCTMHGSAKVWVDNSDANGDQQKAVKSEHCPMCLMSHTGIAPPPVFNFNVHQIAGAEVGQLVFTTVYLTQPWSEPATGPPQSL